MTTPDMPPAYSSIFYMARRSLSARSPRTARLPSPLQYRKHGVHQICWAAGCHRTVACVREHSQRQRMADFREITMIAAAPTFSIAVVTFNRAALVARALDSVVTQRRTDYEIVVLD